jgi:hypothetical protein
VEQQAEVEKPAEVAASTSTLLDENGDLNERGLLVFQDLHPELASELDDPDLACEEVWRLIRSGDYDEFGRQLEEKAAEPCHFDPDLDLSAEGRAIYDERVKGNSSLDPSIVWFEMLDETHGDKEKARLWLASRPTVKAPDVRKATSPLDAVRAVSRRYAARQHLRNVSRLTRVRLDALRAHEVRARDRGRRRRVRACTPLRRRARSPGRRRRRTADDDVVPPRREGVA